MRSLSLPRLAARAAPAALAAALLLLAGCSAIDVVGTSAVTTFTALLSAEEGKVAMDTASRRWVLTSPGGERFEWSSDFAAGSPDFRISLDASPYLDAGLDPAKLPPDRYSYDAASRVLSLSFETGGESFAYAGSPTPLESFRRIVETHRPIIGYHSALDHYGIALGGGNMFEWAKDMGKNEKDMVFVLDPGPLRAAGVDPARITGWAFAKIPVKDPSGKTVDVDKFVKPYNLR
jgi:hypothetical protein